MLKTPISLGYSKDKKQKTLHGLTGAELLHRKSLELSGMARKNPILRSKNLIGSLLAHGARTRRASKAHVTIRLRVYSQTGNRAVSFGYK